MPQLVAQIPKVVHCCFPAPECQFPYCWICKNIDFIGKFPCWIGSALTARIMISNFELLQPDSHLTACPDFSGGHSSKSWTQKTVLKTHLCKGYHCYINADSRRPIIAFPHIPAYSLLLPCGCIGAKVGFSLVRPVLPRDEHSSRTDNEEINNARTDASYLSLTKKKENKL